MLSDASHGIMSIAHYEDIECSADCFEHTCGTREGQRCLHDEAHSCDRNSIHYLKPLTTTAMIFRDEILLAFADDGVLWHRLGALERAHGDTHDRTDRCMAVATAVR